MGFLGFGDKNRDDSEGATEEDKEELEQFLLRRNNSDNNNNNNNDDDDDDDDDGSRDRRGGDETPSPRRIVIPQRRRQNTVLPLSMQIMKQMSGTSCCVGCATANPGSAHLQSSSTGHARGDGERAEDKKNSNAAADSATSESLANYDGLNSLQTRVSAASPLVLGPMLMGGVESEEHHRVLEQIISEYIEACRFYGCGDRINPGVLTTLRYSLPSMRVRGSFHDEDMLALAEILLKYANGPLKYIRRLDFSIAAVKGSTRPLRKAGFASHGALTLAKVLQSTENVREVLLQRNRVGPYGATAIFIACSQNPSIQKLVMRSCRIGERGALTFAEFICPSTECGLIEVDLSANRIGFRGCLAVEQAMLERSNDVGMQPIEIDLEGNLIFQEVMNSVTHGLGILMAIVGAMLLSKRVEFFSSRHKFSCALYSTSLLVLYTSSTLYHSFSTLRTTKWVFEILDKSAIYILIAGSYTPFLQIVLVHQPIWSIYLLLFLWVCCIMGIWVEFAFPVWQYRGRFSLAMYLGMGWAALVCLPEVARIIPVAAMNLMVLGGVAYTSGVPFFLRSNNLDHAIWHLFVLAGSVFHWCAIYFYVAPVQMSPDGVATYPGSFEFK